MPTAVLLALSLLAATGAVLVVPAASAFACSCVSPTMTERIPEAVAVFTGRATAQADAGGGDSDRAVSYTFAVDRVLKGEVGASVEVTSAASSASCGIDIEPGRDYLMLVRAEGSGFTSSLCSGSQPLTAAVLSEAEAVTGPSSPPTTSVPATPDPATPPASAAPTSALAEVDRGPRWGPYAVAAGLVLLAAGAWVLVRRRGTA